VVVVESVESRLATCEVVRQEHTCEGLRNTVRSHVTEPTINDHLMARISYGYH
jgi:hypothetical protein